MNTAQEQFVEDFGQHMVSWGLSRTTERVYGLLLLSGDPMGLEEMAETLDVAASGPSVAARQRITLGLAQASGERGSRRIRYQALYALEAIFAARAVQIDDLLDRLRQGAKVASALQARRRLGAMSDGLEAWLAAAARMMEQTSKPTRSRR